MTPTTTTEEQPPPRKTTLYCFECGRSGLAEEDWTVRATEDRVALECPDCGTTISSRRRNEESAAESESARCSCPAD